MIVSSVLEKCATVIVKCLLLMGIHSFLAYIHLMIVKHIPFVMNQVSS